MINRSNMYIVNDNGGEESFAKTITNLLSFSEFLAELSPVINKLTNSQIKTLRLRQDISGKIPASFVKDIGGNSSPPVLECVINAITNNNKKITMFISVQEQVPPKNKKTWLNILKEMFR